MITVPGPFTLSVVCMTIDAMPSSMCKGAWLGGVRVGFPRCAIEAAKIPLRISVL